MKFLPTPLAGVWQVHSQPHDDARGSFTRLYCAEAFDAVMQGLCFVQVNHSITRRRGTVRGLHLMRAPAQEYKLVRCLRGRVFDVAADLRRESATYGRWFALELSEDRPVALLIPPGVAHGFQTLADDAQRLGSQGGVGTTQPHRGGRGRAAPHSVRPLVRATPGTSSASSRRGGQARDVRDGAE